MKRGLVLIFGTAVISGFSIFLNKFGVTGIDSSVFAFMKNIIVALFLLSIIGFTTQFRTLKELTKQQWSKLVLIGLIGGSIPFLLFFKGLQLTNGISAALIHKTMFIYVAVLAVFFLKEKLNPKIFYAAILLLAGNFLLLKMKFPVFNLGDLMILAATLFWASENILSKHTLKHLSGNIVAFGRMFFGSLFILIFLAATGKSIALTSTQLSWTAITAIFLLGYVITWYNGLKHVKVTVATSILLLGSPITTLLSFFFLDSPITVIQIFGILSISLGVYIVIRYLEFTTPQQQTHNV
ncbi:DMT family transporter [Candidatus Woesearchaeota archaeon]|nr:DMT family transporter [Candidatus Woesearchaeota archaeon]